MASKAGLVGPFPADNLGNLRHISRDVTTVDTLSEPTTSRDFEWVVRSLQRPAGAGAPKKDNSDKCQVNMLDTVVMERGSMAGWYFTNKMGFIMRKAERNLSLDKVRHNFVKFSMQYPRNELQWAAVFHYAESSTALTRDQFVSNLAQSLDAVKAIQPYALPRGMQRGFVNFRNEYSIYMGGLDAAAVMVTHKYTAALPVGGVDPTDTDPDATDMVQSKDARVNNAVQKMTRDLVHFIEQTRKVKVTKFVAEFCVDDTNVPWFVHSSECLTVAGAAAVKRRREAERARLGLPISADDAPEALGGTFPMSRRPPSPIKGHGAGATSGTDEELSDTELGAPAGYGPRHTLRRMGPAKGRGERVKDRRERELLRALSGEAPEPTTTAAKGSAGGAGARGAQPAKSGMVRGPGGQFQFQDDEEKEPVLGPGGTAAEALGSTQHVGKCPGDFCDVQMGLAADGADPLEGHSAQEQGGVGSRRFSMSMIGTGEWQALVGMGSAMPAVPTGPEARAPKYKVSYRQVAQARAEADLVELMIRRHKGGQGGDYVSGSYYSDANRIAHDFPASYYRDVKVCANCYQVYSKVERERNRAAVKRAALASPDKRGRSRSPGRPGSRSRRPGSSRSRDGSPGRDYGFGTDSEAESKAKGADAGTGIPADFELTGGASGGAAAAADGSAAPVGGRGPFDGYEGEGDDGARSRAVEGLERADAAMHALSTADLAEMRTFTKPPPAVTLVASALMLLLTGEVMDWSEARRVMAGGDRFLQMLLNFDRDRVPARRLRALVPMISNPVFHPDAVLGVNRGAAHLAAWVLGTSQYAMAMKGMAPTTQQAWAEGGAAAGGGDGGTKRGRRMKGGDRSLRGGDRPSLPPLTGSQGAAGGTPITPYQQAMARSGSAASSLGASGTYGSGAGSMIRTASAGSPAVRGTPISFAEKLEKRRRQQLARERRDQRSAGDGGGGGAYGAGYDSVGKHKRGGGVSALEESMGESGRLGSVAPGAKTPAARATLGLSGTGGAAELTGSTLRRGGRGKKKKLTAAEQAARAAKRRAQEYQAKRLMGGGVGISGPGGMDDGGDDSANIHLGPQPKVFQCADGHTSLLYLVLGIPDSRPDTRNFVVLHDMFDTLESTQILLREFVIHNRGQVLLINYPGQAFTTYRGGEGGDVLNNEFLSERVAEMLAALSANGDFTTKHQKWHMLGFGNGGNIGACLASRHHEEFDGMLQSMVLFNSFAHVDPQLTAVLHSTVNVFSCFPDNRPDLPVSYFARFMFSEAYVNRVTQDLALSIFTAVTNPITLDGRLRLCRGALRHVDLRAELPRCPVPLVLVQATDDVLVSPANADPFLDGRAVRHLWSHEEAGGAAAHFGGPIPQGSNEAMERAAAKWLGERAVQHLQETLRKPDGALVLWLKAGHEVRQEAKANVLRLIRALSDPKGAVLGGGAAAGSAGGEAGVGPSEVMSPTRFPAKPQFGVPEQPQKLKVGRGREPGRSRTATTKGKGKGRRRKGAAAGAGVDDDDDEAEAGAEFTDSGTDGDVGARSLSPSTRKQRLAETEREFEEAMREHKQQKARDKEAEAQAAREKEEADAKMARAEERRVARERQSKERGAVSPLTSPSKAATGGVETSPIRARPSPGGDADGKHGGGGSAAAETKAREPDATPSRPLTEPRSQDVGMATGAGGITTSTAPAPSPVRTSPIRDTRVGVTSSDIGPIAADTGAGVGISAAAPHLGGGTVTAEITAARQAEEAEMERRLAMLRDEQEARRRRWAREDAERLALLQVGVDARASSRAAASDERAEQLEAEARDMLLQGTKASTAAHAIDPLAGESEPDTDEEDAAAATAAAKAAAAPTRAGGARAGAGEGKGEGKGDDGKEGDIVDAAAEAMKVGEGVKPDFTDLSAMFEQMESEDKVDAAKHKMALEEFKRVQREMAEAEKELARQRMMADSKERQEEMDRAAIRLQPIARGFIGRIRYRQKKAEQEDLIIANLAATRIQAVARGRKGRKQFKERQAWLEREKTQGVAARTVQRVFRGMQGRVRVTLMREDLARRFVQRVYRGHLARRRVAARRREKEREGRESVAAAKIQATWRMHFQHEAYRELQILQLAAMQVQRMWRGWLGRRRAARRRTWDRAAPGPERLALGLEMIEGAKESFERQRQEIDALHRAQERAETRVSEIQAGLSESEVELATLERELREVDQLDQDLREMTHNKNAIEVEMDREKRDREEEAARDGTGAYRAGGTAGGGGSVHSGSGRGGSGRPGSSTSQRSKAAREAEAAAQKEREAEVYALEVAIHMKKAEREKKRRELEAEFAGVFAEVEKKKSELVRLEDNISDMEATRQRKDREFTRLQRNLTELLAEQKSELDSLREKGVQLETATATSAAAAAATASAAKEHEKRTAAIFSSTEELLKFQFMSMSLSYFSSLNMLGQLRDINQDTTAAAISSSADTAAAAAAAAAAANIPSLKQMTLGAGEFLDAATKAKKLEEAEKIAALEEAKAALAEPFPTDVAKWRVQDVGRWLDTLTLGQYKRSFEEAAVDGEFLMELRAEDLRDVLGVEHSLHVRKLLVARDKIKPLTKDEQERRRVVEHEARAAAGRGEQLDVFSGEKAVDELLAGPKKDEGGPPDMDTVFSQIRHNRVKRLQESLEAGFNIEIADDNGNTALLVAAQNVNKKAIELLLDRGAQINAQNKAGNTALHYCMAYDKEGTLGEYLIDRGANDMLENGKGLSPYDGLE